MKDVNLWIHFTYAFILRSPQLKKLLAIASLFPKFENDAEVWPLL
jgi:hypothetical protein